MPNPRVEAVTVLNDYQLSITFTNKELRVFDMKPYLVKGVFTALNDTVLFEKAHVSYGTVVWNDDIDMSPDTLYLDSKIFTKITA